MSHEAYSALLAFAIVMVIGPTSIKLLKALKFGQSIRQDGPSTHLKKAGTPTMGGGNDPPWRRLVHSYLGASNLGRVMGTISHPGIWSNRTR